MLNFEDKVALVTGAGRGLGRAHALLLASRGAAVVVNDYGGALDGSDPSSAPAESVVAEIRAAGGRAVASTESVATSAGARAIVDTALSEFGRVDIVVNNAGNTGGRPTFGEIADDVAEAMIGVHLFGTLHVTQAAWSHMKEQGYGRVVNTTSGVGLFGKMKSTTYGAAKLGIVGLSASLAIEAEEFGIRVNCVAPIASTRMASDVFGALDKHLDPALVSPAVAYLAHESCPLNGRVLSVGGGRVAEVFFGTAPGYFDPELTPEGVRDNLDQVLDHGAYVVPTDAMAEVGITAALHGL
ncbi:SDR family NAD(P)-dependent oxidoreductase [Nocardioides sp.]|uniref:SDR family NAD(P)-dependent oxidoreductase n=1 Tax=Nocardioides sp. TaxID=35761 RepID=UPI0039E22286